MITITIWISMIITVRFSMIIKIWNSVITVTVWLGMIAIII